MVTEVIHEPMPHVPSIPLVRAGVVHPLLHEARAVGAPVGRFLERFNIPGAVEEDPGLVVPELPLWLFVEAMVCREAGPLFGMHACLKTPYLEIPTLLPCLQGSLNLKELLVRLCAASPTQSNSSRYALREEGDLLWIEETSPPLIPDCPGVVLFDVMGMMQMVRLAAGQDWIPPVISLNLSRCTEIETAPNLNPSRILFSRPRYGIAVPRRLLPMWVDSVGDHSLPGEVPGDLSAVGDFPSQLLIALPSYLPEAGFSIGLFAKAIDMSVRTLQRRLGEAGTSWSRVLERTRFLKALALLRETDLKIVEVAWEVGYTHASTFCHSFHKLSGVSPSEYRWHFGEMGTSGQEASGQ
jgi:AraC-like DNA-binding protein